MAVLAEANHQQRVDGDKSDVAPKSGAEDSSLDHLTYLVLPEVVHHHPPNDSKYEDHAN